ncbi:hypothetical protein [Flavivirga aquatica]|uniref:hypothetical protein n=1 Tax=Flavivirga aquatica TaxID=1849968 RepID=UPI00196ACF62|nr:hypothetical protein [Flavivirga aquatica]
MPKVHSIFKVFIIINAILILIGFIFEIRVFQVYSSQRFGFNGIILSQGVTPYIYLTATILFWFLKDKKMLILTLLLSIVSGVKGVYFAEFVCLSLLVLFSEKNSKGFKIKVIVTLSVFFILSVLIIFSQPTFRNVINSDGLLSALFSNRTDYTLELLNQIKPDNFNILIGAIDLLKVRLELQIIDVVLFFGIIGLLVYFSFFYFIHKEFIKGSVSNIFFFTCLFLSCLSGNLLYIPFASFLFFTMLLCLSKFYSK